MLILIALLLLLATSLSFSVSGLRGAIWVPAFSANTTSALEVLSIQPGTKVYEFGCGDARFLRKAARYKADCTGIEINPFLWFIARVLSVGKGLHIKLGDGWKASFAEADVTFAFIMPQFMERLGAKLTREMKPGTTIITYAYPIPDMKHFRHEHNCYFYTV